MYSPKEERLNVISHAIGIPLMVIVAACAINNLTVSNWGLYIFLFTAFLMFLTSTLYHRATNVVAKAKLRKLDHVAIYTLIAGSYTPFILRAMATNENSKYLLYFIWGLALAGIIYKLFVLHKAKWISAVLYLGMGWLAVFFYKTLIAGLTPTIIKFMVLGGLFYSVGVTFYVRKKMPYHHAIWHVFVFLGVLAHTYAIWMMVFS